MKAPPPSGSDPVRVELGVELQAGDFVIALWRMTKNCPKPACSCNGAPASLLLFRRAGQLFLVMGAHGKVDVIPSLRAFETDEKLIADHTRMIEDDIAKWPQGGRCAVTEIRSGKFDAIRAGFEAAGTPVITVKAPRE